jgi:hypothetical protein
VRSRVRQLNLVTPSQFQIEVALECLLEVRGLDQLVQCYLEGPPQQRFAGCLFDTLGQTDGKTIGEDSNDSKITSDDLVAVSLLDVRFGSQAVHALLVEGACNEALRPLPSDVDLWSAAPETVEALEDVFEILDGLPGVGRTKASKLLARKRPPLAPIVDSLVEGFYGSTGWAHLWPLRDALRESDQFVSRIGALVGPIASQRPSTLRILDIAIWMTRSRARSARDARMRVLGSADAL